MTTTMIKWGFGIAAGAAIGFLYWYYIGCTSGSCAITSSPINSSLYGGLMGGLLLSSINSSKKNKDNKPESGDTEKIPGD